MKNFRLLIDENLSKKLLSSLIMFPESIHVTDCGLEHKDDSDIWNYAKIEGYTILTRDIDFYNLSAYLGCPPKIIHLITPLSGQSTAYFRERLVNNTSFIISFLKSDSLCYLKIE